MAGRADKPPVFPSVKEEPGADLRGEKQESQVVITQQRNEVGYKVHSTQPCRH